MQVARTLPKPSAALAQRAAALAPHEAELDAELDEAAQARATLSCLMLWLTPGGCR